MSAVFLFVRMEQLGSHWTDFHEIWYLRIFLKSFGKIQVSLNSDKNEGFFTWIPIHLLSYRAHFFLERERLQTKVVEKIKTQILCSVTFFFSKILPFMRKCGKLLYSGEGHRWQYGPCALRAGYLRLQIHTHTHTHTQAVWYSLLFHSNNGCTNARQCYVISTLPVLCFPFTSYSILCYQPPCQL